MISEMAPRGKPSMMASREARPVARVSRSLVSLSVSGRNPSVAVRAALGFMQFRLFFAYRIVTQRRGDVNTVRVHFRDSVRLRIFCIWLLGDGSARRDWFGHSSE